MYRNVILTAFLCAASLLLSAATTSAQTLTCICTGSACGNSAIGGDQGDIFTNIAPDVAKQYFTPNANTGWTCITPKVRGQGGPLGCYCKGYCGNGGIGADPNYIDLGKTDAVVAQSYGGGKAGNKTGWLCGKFRGDFKPPAAPPAAPMACVCTGTACGNAAIGGDQGDIFTNVSADKVKQSFVTNPNTGWTCITPKVRGQGGPLGCYCKGYCGNGGIGADPNYIDLGKTDAVVAQSYGGGKAGNKTGWLCGKFRGDFK